MAPTPIEQALLELLGPAVCGHAVLIGDQRKFLSCLVAPPEGKPGAIDEAVLVKAVTEYNENFAKSRAQRIQKITSLIEPFGEQTGELTPTMKVTKRNATEPTHTNTDQSKTKRRRNEPSVQIRYIKPAPSPPTSNLRPTHHPPTHNPPPSAITQVKRKKVIEKYAGVVEGMYAGAPLAGYQSVTF